MNILKLKKINILSIIYSIEYHQDGLKINKGEHITLTDGTISYVEKIIRIRIQDEPSMKKTLLHEITHGILYEFGISNIFKTSNDEVITDIISGALTDTLIRNKLITLDCN